MQNSNEKYDKIKIPISVEIFKLIRDMLFSTNLNIHIKDIIEIHKFLSIIDFDKYTNVIENIPASDYLRLLNRISEVSLENNSTVKSIAIQRLLNESRDSDKFKIIHENKEEISNEDIMYLKKFILEHISASYIFKSSSLLTESLTRIMSGDYASIEEVVKVHRDIIFDSYRELSSLKVKEMDEKLDSGLGIDELTNLATETIKKISTPGFFIDTGLLNLDNAMGGGLKRGALTLFGARTAGFKSGLMLNLACSIKMFSKKLETFDKTKKACIVYLSMENLQSETFQRTCKFALNKDPIDLINQDPRKLSEDLISALTPNTANKDVELKLVYRKSNSIDINDIRNIVTDYEAEGLEVVALFVDYLSTMNSTRYKSKDQETTSLAVADNSRVLYDFAIEKSIAVVSAYQLNRKNYEKHNLVGKEVLSHTGDSIAITRYADYIFVVNREKMIYNKGTNRVRLVDYLKFDEAKQRSVNSSHKGYFYEIFERNNNFRLIHSKYYVDTVKQKPINFEAFDEAVKKYKIEQERLLKEQMRFNMNTNNINNGQQNPIPSNTIENF